MGGPSSGSSSSSDGDATATGAVGVLPPFGAPGTPRSSRRGNSSSASAAGSVGTMPLKRPLSAGRAAVEPGLAAAPRLPPPAKLAYSIHSYSSHAASYHPRNILVNKPGDQSSRWSSASNNHNQFVLLRLDRPAIVQSIVFGKFHKAHVCNLKEFKIFGGMSPDSLTELLHAGLRNDPEMETFPLKHKNGDIMFPIQYIKIQPLVSHGGSFNFAIWYLELRGVKDADIVRGTNERWVNVGPPSCSSMHTFLTLYKAPRVPPISPNS